MATPSRHLVFDIGGTQLRAAIGDGETQSLASMRAVEAPSYVRHPNMTWIDLRAALIAAMTELRSLLDPGSELSSAVVAFPGPIDAEGRVVAAPTLWGALGSYPYAFGQDLQSAWPGVDVRVVNDVTAAGFRYMRDRDDEFCIVTLSTGIGNKVFVRGRALIGRGAKGGEIGHLQVDSSPAAPACDCGGLGHLGALASGRGTVARARREAERRPDDFHDSLLASEMNLDAHTLTAEALATAYGRLDPWASGIVKAGCDALASVFAGLHLAIGVERFVLIGGFGFGLGERFRTALTAATNARCWLGTSDAVEVVFGNPDGACALVGGARAQHLGLLEGGHV